MRKLIAAAFLTGATLLGGVAAKAAIFAEAWSVSNTVASSATPANIPASAPTATFFVPDGGLGFSTQDSGGTTLAAWATGGGGFLLNGATNVALNDHIFRFTGQVTVATGDQFTAQHDDGVTLTIGATTVINTPGPTAPTTTTVTYNGPSGTFDFTLIYAECCGGPAVLNITLPLVGPAPAPEPASLAILGGALVGLGALRRARRAA